MRISLDVSQTRLGVERQRADCEALAARLGWSVVEVFEDNDTSASNGKPRPAYERMMAAVAASKINAVVVWDVDRLTRTPRELEDVIDYADRVGLQLASVGGDIDLGTEQGRMLARMKGTVARYEIEQMSRRQKRKHQERAEAGESHGPRPFGWDRVPGPDGRTIEVINEAEAAVVREVARRLLAGDSLWRIVGDLTERGVLTSKGKPFMTQTLRRVMLRARNVGDRMHNGAVVAQGQWPPLLDRETHERVVATLTDPARRSNNRGTAVKYLLTSKALCGVCGRPVVGRKGYQYAYRTYQPNYGCPHRGCMKVTRNMADVDAIVSGAVVGVLQRDGVRLAGGNPEVIAEATARIEGFEAKLALAADQWAADEITGEQLKRITASIRPKIDAEKRRRVAAEPSTALDGLTGGDAAEGWARADVERRRAILDVIGIRVTLLPVGAGNTPEPEQVRIEWGRS